MFWAYYACKTKSDAMKVGASVRVANKPPLPKPAALPFWLYNNCPLTASYTIFAVLASAEEVISKSLALLKPVPAVEAIAL
ncbi:hypothetical protein [Nostoc sp.]|uniref:hypothetical protein n=2 Tax=Nostoc TaxID=1177 RepID=UPI002FFC4CD6